MLAALFTEATPLDLRILGRVLIHATIVGLAAGAIACLFYSSLEAVEELLFDNLAGYAPLRATGEMSERTLSSTPRPWLLCLLPCLGAFVGSFIARRFAPECEGPGGNAVIGAFHSKKPEVRRRVMWLKPITTILTIATGGAGGREGPTMLIGGSIGSTVGRYLRVSEREKRILLVAGMAAGTAAIFRTPLGAALLAVETLYRDDFESDAVVPAVLASVVAYSVFIGVFGEAHLFATAGEYPFVISHLPLYLLLALLLSGVGATFVRMLQGMHTLSSRWPAWARAGIGGLGVGLLAMTLVLTIDDQLGMGVMGGGYGAAQAAITGAKWLPDGMGGIHLLLLLAVAKMIAATFTIGTRGSAGVFAPALAIGALFGGVFGRLMQLAVDDNIDSGSFALVGMGALFGGIAHAPLGALVMVCELAGSYDLLVPLMLAQGVSFILLRKTALYGQQRDTQQDSPAHPPRVLDVLGSIKVGDVMIADRAFVTFSPATPVPDVMRSVSERTWQDVFPVLSDDGAVAGMITPELLRLLAAEHEMAQWAVAADAMQAAVTVTPDDDLRIASKRMLTHGLREVLVVEGDRIVGFLDEAEIGQTYIDNV